MLENKDRLRRTALFVSAQRPAITKDAYIFQSDSVILDLEDAVAENQKDAARFSLYHLLTTVDYGNTERMVRINGTDTPHWQEDVRVAVAGGADVIRIPKCETAADVQLVEQAVIAAEKEFNRTPKTLLMAALESPLGVLNAFEVCKSSERLLGIAISGGDFRKSMGTKWTASGIDLQAARGHIILAARAAGVQCHDTVFTDLSDLEGFTIETQIMKDMGFDGKSCVNPKQIQIVHDILRPSEQEIITAERTVQAIRENAEKGIGIFSLDGQMLDIAFLPGALRTLRLAKACGLYKGDLV